MGVSFRADKGKWRAFAYEYGRGQINLGYHATKELALSAYDAYRVIHPKIARIRRPPTPIVKICEFCMGEFTTVKKTTDHCKAKSCVSAFRKRHYWATRPRYQEWRKGYSTRNRVRLNAYSREQHQKHPRPYSPDLYRKNILIHASARQNYRARQLSAPGTFTKRDLAIMFRIYGQRCVGCNQPFPFLTVDHKVPLSKGGTNDPDNLQPLCKRCNSSKYDKIMFAASSIRDKSLHLVELGETGMVLAKGVYTHTSQIDLAC